jgi:hypothetical protein
MREYRDRYDKCPHCSKAMYPSFSAARRSARDFIRISGKASGVVPYWSKPCQAFHIGQSTASAYRKAQAK